MDGRRFAPAAAPFHKRKGRQECALPSGPPVLPNLEGGQRKKASRYFLSGEGKDRRPFAPRVAVLRRPGGASQQPLGGERAAEPRSGGSPCLVRGRSRRSRVTLGNRALALSVDQLSMTLE